MLLTICHNKQEMENYNYFKSLAAVYIKNVNLRRMNVDLFVARVNIVISDSQNVTDW